MNSYRRNTSIDRKVLITLMLLVLMIFSSNRAFASSAPQDFLFSQLYQVLIDNQRIDLTSIHPVSLYQCELDTVSMIGNGWISRYLNSKLASHLNRKGYSDIYSLGINYRIAEDEQYEGLAYNLQYYAEIWFDSSFYSAFHLRATNEPGSLNHFSGRKRDISRAGFSSAEVDKSVIGFRNDWLWIEFGRSREIWGPETEDNILLSGFSPAYERIMLQIDKGHFTFRYFYAYLETIFNASDINRYLAGKILEYRLNENFVFSIGEVSVLGGENRPVDWSFLNPLSLHLEVEQNNRENFQSENTSNSILFLNFDMFPTPKLRVSGTIMLDEFQLDREDRDLQEADAFGYFTRLRWNLFSEPFMLDLIGKFKRLDTFIYQHEYPYANFVTHNEMIGDRQGNDHLYYYIGTRGLLRQRIVFDLGLSQSKYGENSLLDNPYRSYGYEEFKKQPFPSGKTTQKNHISLGISAIVNHNIVARYSSVMNPSFSDFKFTVLISCFF